MIIFLVLVHYIFHQDGILAVFIVSLSSTIGDKTAANIKGNGCCIGRSNLQIDEGSPSFPEFFEGGLHKNSADPLPLVRRMNRNVQYLAFIQHQHRADIARTDAISKTHQQGKGKG